MNVLEIAETMGISLRKTSATHGGEFHSPCPRCGGKDRFMIWPCRGEAGAYYCRRCGVAGDAIQFLKDFQNLSYKEACQIINRPMDEKYRRAEGGEPRAFRPVQAKELTQQWIVQAKLLIDACHKELIVGRNEEGRHMLATRGIQEDSIVKWNLGWNNEEGWRSGGIWGLYDHPDQKVWMPKGIVVPYFDSDLQTPLRIKIRRSEWSEQDRLPKYVELGGGSQRLPLYGDCKMARVLVVESELDAILLDAEAGDLVATLALGGCSKKPDHLTDRLLKQAETILLSFDNDDAGRKAYGWWAKHYPKAKVWPIHGAKSPGDAHIEGVNLREWVLQGIKRSSIT